MRRLLVLLSIAVLFASCGRSEPDDAPYVDPGVAPLPGQVVSFTVIGDFGLGNDDEEAVAKAMHKWIDGHAIDAFVTVGDNIYPEAERKYFDAAWTEPFGWVDDAGIPVFPALGNHDVEDGSSEDVIAFFDMPGPWYDEKIGPVHLIVLDSNQVGDPDQTEWLEETISGDEAKWTVVVVHKPPYGCGKYDGTPAVRDAWVPTFRNEADLVLSGHDHNYQRFAPLDGVTYLITGGGGDSFYGLDDECLAETPARLAGNDSIHHFLAVRASAKRLEVLAIATDGSIIDRFVLEPGATR
jgi:hypothetical protein